MKKINIKKVVITTVHIIILCCIVLWMWIFFLITPYQDYDYSLKIVDYDKVDAFKFIWLNGIAFNGVISFIVKKYSKVFFLIHLVLALFSVSCFIWLFTL